MRFISLFVLMISLPGMASAWWNEDWPYRLPVALDTSPAGSNISSTTTNMPVLLRLHSANFEDFFLVQDGLVDVRFIGSDDKTPLKFHVESFDLINQLAFVWVQVPQVSGGLNTEKIWMYYGNETAVAGQDSAGTFDVNQVAVYHFSEQSGLASDQTAYANPASIPEEIVNPASLIGGGLSFLGSGGVIVSDSPSNQILPEKGFSFSAWIKPIGVQNNSLVFYRGDKQRNLVLGIDQSALYARYNDGAATTETPRTAPLTLDSWQHIGLVVSRDTLSIYLNGAEVASSSLVGFELGGDMALGASLDGDRGFVGEMDEARLSNIARGSDHFQVIAKSEGVAGNLIIVGKGEQLGNAGGTNYFVTIFQSTGTEGWVVIVMLAIMAVLSWMVMAFKAAFLGRVKKDNQAFLSQYQKLSNHNIAAIDREGDESVYDSESASLFGEHDHFQSSPLYHIYHRGIAELKDRVENRGQSALSESAVNSIRSGLEAYVTREIQALNRNMVLLTIAVSGGPFIGLLGTVLGVMITFAAIAASGDVNIAAIAPGVAAALLTTVAGLVVAIPAMFGYNWLATRIKAMVADMHVFTEEFVTKMAEQYSHEERQR